MPYKNKTDQLKCQKRHWDRNKDRLHKLAATHREERRTRKHMRE